MSSFIAKWILRYKGFVLGVLGPLGFWGAGLAGLVDSGTIPIPMDPLIATYAWNDHRHAWLYVVMAAAGSAVGGLIPFLLGRAGGELFLLRRIDRTRYEEMMARFEKQEFLAMAIPSALPPPTPWKAFVFGAGVFEILAGGFQRLNDRIDSAAIVRQNAFLGNCKSGRLANHQPSAPIGMINNSRLHVYPSGVGLSDVACKMTG